MIFACLHGDNTKCHAYTHNAVWNTYTTVTLAADFESRDTDFFRNAVIFFLSLEAVNIIQMHLYRQEGVGIHLDLFSSSCKQYFEI